MKASVSWTWSPCSSIPALSQSHTFILPSLRVGLAPCFLAPQSLGLGPLPPSVQGPMGSWARQMCSGHSWIPVHTVWCLPLSCCFRYPTPAQGARTAPLEGDCHPFSEISREPASLGPCAFLEQGCGCLSDSGRPARPPDTLEGKGVLGAGGGGLNLEENSVLPCSVTSWLCHPAPASFPCGSQSPLCPVRKGLITYQVPKADSAL